MSTNKNTTVKTATKKTAKKASSKPAEVVTKGPDRTHKICSICKTPKPLDMYYRPQKDCRCKDCNKVYAANLKARKAADAEAAAIQAVPVKASKRTAKKTKK